jgi:hypothetical protein
MKKNIMILTSAAGFALGAALVFNLTGCVGEVDADYAGPDDYVYYPGYEMYYGERSHEWYYHDGDRWVGRPEPHGVTVDAIHSAPSVHMTFHDNPGSHHADVVKQYPHNWAPAGGGHDDHDDHDHH